MTLREARFFKGLTQWDIAIKTGISQPTLSLFERGYKIPKEDEKKRIAKALGCKVRDVFPTEEAAAMGNQTMRESREPVHISVAINEIMQGLTAKRDMQIKKTFGGKGFAQGRSPYLRLAAIKADTGGLGNGKSTS